MVIKKEGVIYVITRYDSYNVFYYLYLNQNKQQWFKYLWNKKDTKKEQVNLKLAFFIMLRWVYETRWTNIMSDDWSYIIKSWC